MALASNITGVPSIPTGFSALDGSTISDVTSPMDGVTLPNVNNSVFLAGNSTAGTTGGVNSYTLTEAQLPSHTHTINHGHSDDFALGNATVANSTHNHNIAHVHKSMRFDFDTGRWKTQLSSDPSNVNNNANGSEFIRGNGSDTSTPNTTNSDLNAPFSDKNYHTTGVLSPPAGTAGSGALSGAVSATSTVTVTGSVTTNSDSSGSIGSGSSIDNKPNFISTQYIVRIK